MIPASIKNKIEEISGGKITGIRSVTGGCISQTFEIIVNKTLEYFLKFNPDADNDMFIKESNGLKEIAASKTIRVPAVIYAGKNFILLERIKPAPRKKHFFSDFGLQFSMLHRTNADTYGFYEDNYIGSTRQVNIAEGKEKTSWAEFYLDKRILFQYKLAEQLGYITSDLRKRISYLENKIVDILNGSEEPPTLLHGDLWSGNFITDDSGSVCLIDPAVYYGHREADLAMTKLFGGFPEEFYNSYNENFPFAQGYNERENIYKLYHALNHLNLFGKVYYGLTLALAQSYK